MWSSSIPLDDHNNQDIGEGHRLVQARISSMHLAPRAIEQYQWDIKGKCCVPVLFVPDWNWCTSPCWSEVPDGFKALAVGYSGKYIGIW
jgi:hypothetical protein